ncbi:MAG: helicase HerA-like domain-containing protein [Pseudomonadota bacterium]
MSKGPVSNGDTDERLFIGAPGGAPEKSQDLLLRFGNRHGLIAGATGTGKTVSLQILAEGFSRAGVPVFMADVKGDLSGVAKAGSHEHKLHDKLISRAESIGLSDYGYEDFPVVFWDLFGEQGHPIRATVSDLGPLMLARMLDLNEVQEGVLNVVFRAAQDDALPLIDLKDLRSMLVNVADKAAGYQTEYGNVSAASVGAIQRRLLVLENQGADKFFGEPALRLSDMIHIQGAQGRVNVLAADRLMNSPRLYATFLFWMMSKLFDELPEVGDPDKPVMAFFFDEAHLLFDDAPKALIDQVERVARLIRSKGVGVYFITQNPIDVPDTVLGQLGNRVQHALRAYTPRDRKALKAAAETFRENPGFDTGEAITALGVGEALVSTLEDKGAPSMVERVLVRPPASQIGPLTEIERAGLIDRSPIAGVYDQTIDRVSAFEKLKEKADHAAEMAARELEAEERRKAEGGSQSGSSGGSRGDGLTNTFLKSALRSLASRAGTRIVRAIFGR